jgi:protein-S-isoprenylcysteine O-methyltransferase Ste14
MNTTNVITVLIIAYILRMYTMKFMTKKQRTGKIYYPWSYPLLFTTYMVTFFGAFLEYFLKTAHYSLTINIFGIIVLFTGILITGWAIKSVGSSWSQHIEIKTKHHLCTTGPYRYLRNPYYFGVMFELIGACLAFNAHYSFYFLFLVHTPFVIFRANLEEKIMLKHLPGYRKYRGMVKNFL